MTRPSARRRPAQRRPERGGSGRRGSGRDGGGSRRPTPGEYRRRRLAALLIGLLLLVGLGLGGRVLLYDAGLVDVETVQVTGLVTVPETDVRAAAAIQTGSPLADLDTAAAASRVARLPAVASVQVAREWPHTVVIEVTERTPVASVATPGGIALVDGSGVVYPGPPPPQLPRLTFGAVGPGDPSTRDALAALAALPEDLLAQVLTVDVAMAGVGVPGQVAFGLTGDRQVRWGTAERSAEKAAVLGPLLTEPGRVYDVASPDLPTVRR